MTGEERHERCRHGFITKGWQISAVGEKPTVTAACGWQVPDPCPPAVKRCWGGNVIETEDCAKCPAYDPL